MKNTNKIRMGIIGYGAQGQNYASILTGAELPGVGGSVRQPERCILTAVSEVSGRAEKAFGAASGVAVFRDWRRLVTSGACDAVVLTVPHFLHAEITVFALEHGVHVLCEKPAAVRACDVRQMIGTSEKHPDITFALMLNQRANPLVQKLKALIGSGELGEIRRSHWVINNWWRPDSYYRSSPWRGTWNGEGGGLLVNQAPHQLDLWSWLCGKPTRLYALCKEGAWRDIEVENDVTIVTEYENGATGTFIACTHDPMGTDRLEIDLSKGKIVVEDSRRAAVFRFAADEAVWNDTMDHRMLSNALRRVPHSIYSEEIIEENMPFGADHAAMFDNFADHILTGAPLIAPGTDGLLPVQLANTAQLSAAQRAPLVFPCDEEAFDRYLAQRMEREKAPAVPVPVKDTGQAPFRGRNRGSPSDPKQLTCG